MNEAAKGRELLKLAFLIPAALGVAVYVGQFVECMFPTGWQHGVMLSLWAILTLLYVGKHTIRLGVLLFWRH